MVATRNRVVGMVFILALHSHASALAPQNKASCGKPPQTADATVVRRDERTIKFMHGEMVQYACAPGHRRLEGNRYIRCFHGDWTPLQLKCLPVTCKEPTGRTKSKHTEVSGVKSSYSPGDVLDFRCLPPYVLKGSSSSTCGDNGQWIDLPKCKRVCNKPVNTNSNAYLIDTRTHFFAGDQVSYTCAHGYFYSGGSTIRTCIPEKWSWSPLGIQCERKSCGSAGEIENGEFIYNGAEFGDTATAVCAQGHVLVGKATRTCLSEGWSGRPAVCEAVRCIAPTTKTNAERTGSWSASYEYRQVIQYRCREGTLVGEGKIWCTENGTWSSPPPTCGGFCNKPVNTNSNAYLNDTRTHFFAGDQVSYTCAHGYFYSGGSTIRTCMPEKWSWSPLGIQCERKSCGSAGEIENGEFIYNGAEFGDTATAVCAQGHVLVGKATRTCLSEGWSGRPAVCEAVRCIAPTTKTNAERTGSWSALYEYRQVIQYRCREGTLVGEGKIWCTENGTWSSPPPTCGGFCNKPVNTNSNAYLIDKRTHFFAGDQVSYTCAHGYFYSGGSTIRTCMPEKWSWSPLGIQCERKSCGSAGEIENGEFIYNGAEFGDTATAVCAQGHVLVGKATRTCLSEGWSGRPAVCEAVRCIAPTTKTNAERTGSWGTMYEYRQVIQYRCRQGTLVGKGKIWCTENGTWSSPPPTCSTRFGYVK